MTFDEAVNCAWHVAGTTMLSKEDMRAAIKAIWPLPTAPAEPRAAEGAGMDAVFAPCWPEGLRLGDSYRIPCDDKGRNGGSWLQVWIAPDCDVHLMMQDWEEMPKGEPSSLPTFRSRTALGGGRNDRTHQALLWLAQAIRLDTQDREARYGH